MALKIKKRCIRCLTVLREDGTCGNEKCSRYTPEKPKEENGKAEQYAKGWEREAAATLSFKFLEVMGWVLSQVLHYNGYLCFLQFTIVFLKYFYYNRNWMVMCLCVIIYTNYIEYVF